jgi:hypothetical protein
MLRPNPSTPPDPDPVVQEKQSIGEQIKGTFDLLKMILLPQRAPKSPKPPKEPKKAETPPLGATPPVGGIPPGGGTSPVASALPEDDAPPAGAKPSFAERHPRTSRFLWQRKIAPAFWTISGILSLVVNLILIVVLIILAKQIFFLKQLVGDQLIGGLYNNFVLMDQAHIITDIQVNTQIPVQFDLPLSQGTSVTLMDDTPINGASINLNGVIVPLNIVLPKGTALGITLDLVVPVDATIPVSIPVHVDIPLEKTELHKPFVGLQNVVAPYKGLLDPLPNNANQACPPSLRGVCNWFFGK